MVVDIVKGHFAELFNQQETLSNSRLNICSKCPLYAESPVGMICNKDLYLNPQTNEVAYEPTPGFYRGCNCRLKAKTRLVDAHCPAHKW